MIYEKAAKSSMKKALILFTTKTKSPPMFSVLSRSPHFQDRIAFILVSENLKSILKEFGVTAPLPKLLLLSMPEKTTVAYDGAVEYKAIATYLQQALGITSGSTSQSVPVDEEEKKPSESKKADGETEALKEERRKEGADSCPTCGAHRANPGGLPHVLRIRRPQAAWPAGPSASSPSGKATT